MIEWWMGFIDGRIEGTGTLLPGLGGGGRWQTLSRVSRIRRFYMLRMITIIFQLWRGLSKAAFRGNYQLLRNNDTSISSSPSSYSFPVSIGKYHQAFDSTYHLPPHDTLITAPFTIYLTPISSCLPGYAASTILPESFLGSSSVSPHHLHSWPSTASEWDLLF